MQPGSPGAGVLSAEPATTSTTPGKRHERVRRLMVDFGGLVTSHTVTSSEYRPAPAHLTIP